MKRFSMAKAARISCVCLSSVALLCGVLAGTATAAEIEVGQTPTALIAPACPAGVSAKDCTIILTQVTVLETLRDGLAYPTTIHHAGEIVAFSLGISAINSNTTQLNKIVLSLNSLYGGPPEAQLVVLKPVGPHGNYRWQVAAQGQPVALLPYLGEVAQFPLLTPLPVVPGEVLGVTVPTWAPILSIDLTPAASFAYRQSKSKSCNEISPVVLAQLTIGDTAGYGCSYPGNRVEYSATEVTSPVPTR